ncbi:MAG: BAX inhibitor (BI)-1/YccA family protein, partial [Methylophaga sp.]
MNYDSQSTVVRSQESALQTNKLLRNTYALLALTLGFSAVTAGLSMAFNLPHPGIIITLIGYFGLLFLTAKLRNS